MFPFRRRIRPQDARGRDGPEETAGEPRLVPLPDDHPRGDLWTEPLVVTGVRVLEPETLEGGWIRAGFRLTVRDAEGRRCPDLAVHARIAGPHRSASGMGHTDLMGRVTFRMAGPPGTYRLEVTDVAAGGLTWDRRASQLTAEAQA